MVSPRRNMARMSGNGSSDSGGFAYLGSLAEAFWLTVLGVVLLVISGTVLLVVRRRRSRRR